MSDYIDTVNIEGVEYDIQDTQTKESLQNLANSLVVSSEKIDTGQKWFGNKPIYKQLFSFSSTNYTDATDRRSFELAKPNNIYRILSMSGIYSAYDVNDNFMIGESLPAFSMDASLKSFLWINTYFGSDLTQHLLVACQKASDYRRVTAQLLIEYIEQ